jgi:glutamate racemase
MDPLENKLISSLFAKEHVTLLITDSGLGGLAIFAEIAARLESDPIFPEVTLIYYNAWPEQHRGYSRLKDMDERIRVFDRALEGMKQYQPDMIMVACNTLSALYDKTEFSRKETIPVIDMVRFGVDMIYENLSEKTGATAVLLGTVTTIASDAHRLRLIKKGIAPDRLVTQPCDQLATQIEKGPDSDTVKQMIDTFMNQAVEKMGPGTSEVVVALFCTHFGFSQTLIKEKLENRLKKPVTMLNPNQWMADFLFNTFSGARYEHSIVNLQVVSRIVWDQIKIDAVSKIVEKQSFETAQALRAYEWIPDLFSV